MKKVIVVESAAKTKTIRAFLRGEYSVIACGGHIMDLPEDELGIDVDNDFNYELRPLQYRGSSKVDRVREQLSDADEIYLATDPDREGEAIAADLMENCVPEDTPVQRIEFNAIVYQAVQEALENPRAIDENRVEAQRARRVLDRLIGFVMSSMAQFDPEGPGLPSVGRVLAPAVSLVVDREEEIENFEPRNYWIIKSELNHDNNEFTAQFEQEWDDFEEAKEAVESIKDTDELTVTDCNEDPEDTYNPLPPYTTDSLQEEADYLLGFSPDRTMQLAQDLYQGLEIDGSPQALITYMRTDSTRLTPTALNLAKEAIQNRDDLEEDLYKGRTWQPQGGEQDAHEAIRPTVPEDPQYFPDNLDGKIEEPYRKLYELIYVRFLASQMKPAIYHRTELELESNGYKARSTGYELIDSGFLDYYRELHPDHGREESDVPALREGTGVEVTRSWPEPEQTSPPPRYREGSLVRELKQRGIGRPSTYSDILSKIKRSQGGFGYIRKVRNTLQPTERGIALCEYLHNNYEQVISYEYTAKMEEQLEKIEEGENDFKSFIAEEFEWLRDPYEHARNNGWLSGNKPTPAQVEFLLNLAEETETSVPEEVFESRDEVSEWIDKLQEDVTPILELSSIHEVDVDGVPCHRFKLFFNKSLPDEEREFLKNQKMKYKSGDQDELPAYQFQRQDREVVEKLWRKLKERYEKNNPVDAEFRVREVA